MEREVNGWDHSQLSSQLNFSPCHQAGSHTSQESALPVSLCLPSPDLEASHMVLCACSFPGIDYLHTRWKNMSLNIVCL